MEIIIYFWAMVDERNEILFLLTKDPLRKYTTQELKSQLFSSLSVEDVKEFMDAIVEKKDSKGRYLVGFGPNNEYLINIPGITDRFLILEGGFKAL